MEEILGSRLLNNLRRDLSNDYYQDESLSIMNTSGIEIEVTDDSNGVTKIVYPRSILHTNRPHDTITIRQFTDSGTYEATISRAKIKKNLFAVETPIKFVTPISSYSDILNLQWVNKALKNSDRIVITPLTWYYIETDVEKNNNSWIILLFIILIVICTVCLLW